MGKKIDGIPEGLVVIGGILIIIFYFIKQVILYIIKHYILFSIIGIIVFGLFVYMIYILKKQKGKDS